jgi:hypothetical protein
MRPRWRADVGRDQAASPFSAILMRFCEATDATGAALVDAEGETVDYAGALNPFDIKVAAAEWRLVLRTLMRLNVPGWPQTRTVLVRAELQSYGMVPITEGYALVAALPRHCFRLSRRALDEALREIALEAGWEPVQHVSRERERWTRVQVRTSAGDASKPEAVWHDGAWCRLEILGRYAPAGRRSRREVGYRARLSSGVEISLVHEPLDRWFADDMPAARA